MTITYLSITNDSLREINEVPLTEGQFLEPRGIQQYAKTAVNRAYFDIIAESVEWPWLHADVARVEGTEVFTLTPGVQWYDKAVDDLEVDWQTFYVTDKDPSVPSAAPPTISKNLTYITYDQWAVHYREKDNQRVLETRGDPEFVIRHPNNKIGISPAPKAALFVEYFVWKTANSFDLSTDLVPFPDEFKSVFLARIVYYLWKFRENIDLASMSDKDYEKGLAGMKRILLSNKSEKMRAV
jgi:hypothetical protein